MKKLSRRDFGKGLGVGVAVLSMMAPRVAGASLSGPTSSSGAGGMLANPPFSGFSFGDSQRAEMVCIKGAGLQTQPKYNYSRYKMPVDISFYGNAEIGTPAYDYYDDQLLRITFTVVEKGEKYEATVNSVTTSLDKQHGLTKKNKIRRVHSRNDETWIDEYVTGQGHLVGIIRKKRGGGWKEAYVRIYDRILMDRFCMEVNPDYMPK